MASGLTATSYTDTASLVDETQYFYKVSATSAGGTSPDSAVAPSYAYATPPIPMNVTAVGGAGQVFVDWDDETILPVSYNVQRALSAMGPWTTVATALSSSAFTDNTVNNGTDYYYEISATHEGLTSAWTGMVHAKTLAVSQVAVQITAPGYQPKQAIATLVEGRIVRLNAALTPSDPTVATLYGQVRDAVTGANLPSSTVTVGAQSVPAGPRGAYMVNRIPVPPLAEDVGASNAGYYPLALPGLPVAGGQAQELDLGLVSTGTLVGSLHGYVFDALHGSIRLSGARVSAGRFLQALAAAPDGHYNIPYVPVSASPLRATATIQGYVPRTFAGVVVTAGVPLELDFPMMAYADLTNFGSLIVTVQSFTGAALAGALVVSGGVGVPQLLTAADGTATFSSLRAGIYTVVCALPGYRIAYGTVTVVAGQAVRLALTMRPFPAWYTGGQIWGHVTAESAPPGGFVQGCLVSAAASFPGSDVLTDASGFYVIENAPPAAYTITFDHPDYVAATRPCAAIAQTSVEVDAQLVPWDGRLPNGWRIFFSAAKPLSRRAGWGVVCLDADEATTTAARATTQPFLATANTLALGRFRRVRYDKRAKLIDPQATLKLAIGYAPGAQTHGAGAMAIGTPRPLKES